MMVGEFDYTSLLVDAEDQRNNDTGASLVPFPEASYTCFYIFVLTVSVALMNLLVSMRGGRKGGGEGGTAAWTAQ